MKACARCKVTVYCDADCQKRHWKKEHKHICTPQGGAKLEKVFASDDHRPSLLYDVAGATPFPAEDLVVTGINTKRGTMHVGLSTKELKETKDENGVSLYDKGARRKPKTRNIHGNKEVKGCWRRLSSPPKTDHCVVDTIVCSSSSSCSHLSMAGGRGCAMISAVLSKATSQLRLQAWTKR
jgi:hypothetical protein